MKQFSALLLLTVFLATVNISAAQPDAPRAGDKITPEQVAESSLEPFFTANPLDDTVFARMQGKSYKADCTLPRSELRYVRVLHYNLQGEIQHGELVCNKAIAGDLLEIFRALYDAHYPIERMVLIDDYDANDDRSMRANNSSAFNFRFVSGTSTLSKHSRGMAVDINPLYNPYVRIRNGQTMVDPPEAAPYADRSKKFPCKIDHNDLACKLFKEHGFIWGGDWKSLKDYQHFEKE